MNSIFLIIISVISAFLNFDYQLTSIKNYNINARNISYFALNENILYVYHRLAESGQDFRLTVYSLENDELLRMKSIEMPAYNFRGIFNYDEGAIAITSAKIYVFRGDEIIEYKNIRNLMCVRQIGSLLHAIGEPLDGSRTTYYYTFNNKLELVDEKKLYTARYPGTIINSEIYQMNGELFLVNPNFNLCTKLDGSEEPQWIEFLNVPRVREQAKQNMEALEQFGEKKKATYRTCMGSIIVTSKGDFVTYVTKDFMHIESKDAQVLIRVKTDKTSIIPGMGITIIIDRNMLMLYCIAIDRESGEMFFSKYCFESKMKTNADQKLY